MIKEILMAATLALPLAAFAADTTTAGATKAPAAEVQPKKDNTVVHSQRTQDRTLRASCNKRAELDKLTGEARKKYIARCMQGTQAAG